MKNLKILLYTFLFGGVFFIFIVVGIVLGFRIGSFIEVFPYSGYYASWKPLNGSVKFTEIVDVNPDTIWARTTEGKLFFGELCFNESKTCDPKWRETTSVPNNAHDNDYWPDIIKSKSCPEDDQGYPKKLSGEVVECVTKSFLEGGKDQSTYIALLQDGTLWQWYQFHPNNDVPLVALCIGPFAGLLLGIGVGVGFLRTLQKRYKISIKQ